MGSIGFVVGIILVWKTFAIAQVFGSIYWAEQHLGSGSSYMIYKLVGIIFIALSILYAFGLVDNLFSPFRNLFGGFIRR